MKLNEIPVGGIVNLSVQVEDKVIRFYSKVMVRLTDSILVDVIKEKEKSMGFGGHNVQVVYVLENGDKPIVWVQAKVKLVKYKNVTYHQILAESEGRPFSRQDNVKLPVGIKGTATGKDFSGEVTIRDISVHGISFVSDVMLTGNTPIRIRFNDLNRNFNLAVGVCWFTSESNTSRYVYGCMILSKNVNIEAYINEKQNQ